MNASQRDARLRELDAQLKRARERYQEMGTNTAVQLKTSIVRDMVAASLYPFAIHQNSDEPWRTEEGRRKKLRDLAKLCYMAADEFIKVRDKG